MGTLTFAETFSITALTSGLTFVAALSAAAFQARTSARQAEQAQLQFEQNQREQRRTIVHERRVVLAEKARETQREALNNVQRQVDLVSRALFKNDTTADRGFQQAVAEFKMWVSRIDNEDILEAAFEYLDRCDEFETRLAEPPHNWIVSAEPVSVARDKLIALTGHMIAQLHLYVVIVPEIEYESAD